MQKCWFWMVPVRALSNATLQESPNLQPAMLAFLAKQPPCRVGEPGPRKDEGEGDPFENLERQILQAVKETSRVTRKAQLNRSKSGISGAGSSIPSSIPTSTTQSSKVSTGGSVSISLDD